MSGVIGEAGFVWYPNEADGSPYTLALGQCFTQYAEAPAWTVSDAVSLSGARQRCIGGTGRRYTLTIQRIKASTARGREATVARLAALQNHLNRGGSVAFTARIDKAVAVVLNGPLTRGDTGVVFGSQPFTALFGAQSLAVGDVVRLETSERATVEEQAVVSQVSSGGFDLVFAEELLHTVGGPVLLTYAYCFPVLKKPDDAVNVNITSNLVGRLWSMQLELVTAPNIVWGIVDAGEGVLGQRDEANSGDAGLTLDDSTFRGNPESSPLVMGSTRPGTSLRTPPSHLSRDGQKWGF